jgi:2-dehydro-3-deoxyphosphogluconate aldolase/(4S)-4-hydroxy-2-oxoglutarate aldolase
MPTGGVKAENVKDWFAAGVIAVGAGSELCPKQLAQEGKFDEITQKAAEYVKIVASSRIG